MADIVWSGTRGGDDDSADDTSSYGSEPFGDSQSQEDPIEMIKRGESVPGILRMPSGAAPKMPATGTINTAPPPPEKHASFADYNSESSEGITTTTTTILRAEQVPVKRGRGRPKKNAPVLTQEEAKIQLTPHQAQVTQNRIDKLDGQRAEKEKEDKKKAVEEEIKRREQALTEEEQEVVQLLQKLSSCYRFWPEYKLSCPRKSPFTVNTPRQAIIDEIARIMEDRKANKAYNSVCKLHIMLTGGIEYLAIEGGIPLQGLAHEAKKSMFVFEDTLKELALEYGEHLVQGPAMEYVSSLAWLAKEVMENNVRRMQGTPPPAGMSKQAAEQFQRDYSHL